MPWELSVRPSVENPVSHLGSVDEVKQLLREAVQGITFVTNPTGAKSLKRRQDQELHVPPAIRESLENTPGSTEGNFKGDEFSMEIFWTSKLEIDELVIGVRGQGNPLPLLTRIGRIPGWMLTDCVTGKRI